MSLVRNQMEYIILNWAFLRSAQRFGYRIRIKLDKDTLAVEQNNYLTKIVNVYIVYELYTRLRNTINNFKFKNWLLETTNIIKHSDKEKYLYSGYGITFDSAGSWSFYNDFSGNVVIFGIDNSSSSHVGNSKNKFLVLGEVSTYGIDNMTFTNI